MDHFPFVSIILLNYNGVKYIQSCIDSILKSDYRNFELIVVDNSSSDQSLDIVEREFQDNRITIIRSDRNLGFAAGNNLGVRHAKGNYVVLLNIDTVVEEQWLTQLIRLMESDGTIGVAQPKLLSLTNRSVYDSAGDYIDFYGNNFRLAGEWEEKDEGQYDTIREIFSARGAALITRKEIVEKVGLFDEDFFMTFEDIDFCWRVRLFGKRITFVPTSTVYHKGRGITVNDASMVSHLDMHGFKNVKSCMIKNYDLAHMIRYAILPTVADIITLFFLIEPFLTQTENKWARISGKLKGYLWVLRNAGRLAVRRRHVQRDIRRVPDSEVMKHMVRTSAWDLVVFAINVKRFGYLRARMLYVKDGLDDS
jgi:GT2 family glycosyltransferase